METSGNDLRQKLRNKLSGMRLNRKTKINREQEIDNGFKKLGINKDEFTDAIKTLSKCNKEELENLATKIEGTLTQTQKEQLNRMGNMIPESSIPAQHRPRVNMIPESQNQQQSIVDRASIKIVDIPEQQRTQPTMSQPDSGIMKTLTSQEQTVLGKMLSRSS
jgi:hypothetical protein